MLVDFGVQDYLALGVEVRINLNIREQAPQKERATSAESHDVSTSIAHSSFASRKVKTKRDQGRQTDAEVT